MAKKRKKKHSTAHLKKYQFKKKKRHHTGGTHVAKKRRSKKRHHGGGKRRHHTRSRRRRHGGGGGGELLSVPIIAAGAGIGWVEHQMKTDATFILNKIPTPLAPLGRLGNVVGAAYLARRFGGRFLPPVVSKALGYFVRAGGPIVAYQLMRKQLAGAGFKEGAEVFTIAGHDDNDGRERILGDDDIDALGASGRFEGNVSWDPGVVEPGTGGSLPVHEEEHHDEH